ncbi:unnamed protein product [Malus baccata var. baccata]
MGRGKVELKRIENKINQQVTFAKRRKGLLKKAYELTVLCDAEVALIVFSTRGKLSEFSSGPSMAKTLERYQRCTYGELGASQSAEDEQSRYQDYLKLKTKVETLQRTQRHFLGEDLVHLGMTELQQLENQLDMSLKKIRSTKTQFMHVQISELQRKEEMLLEANTGLRRKLEESTADLQRSWNSHHQAAQLEGFPEHLQFNNTLQIGYSTPAVTNDEVNVATSSEQSLRGFIPGRVQLKRIENKINRQVTFSKRRTGLLKKAHEISVLCDAQVALIVFSNKGKLFDMEQILERYERYSYAERQLVEPDFESQGNWTFEYSRLKAKAEVLQRNHRHYLGEDLDSLTLKEIQNLEQQLDTALKQIRLRKNQLMNESISELQRKRKAIQEENNLLAKKIKEKEKAAAQPQVQNWEPQNHGLDLLPQPLPCLNNGGTQQDEFLQVRRNQLDLTLEPLYECHLGCFAA